VNDLRAGDLEVRLADSPEFVDAAQALRYRVFYEEMAAVPSPEMAARKPITLKCDFCGAECARVRRVALDLGYDRLGQRHVVRYACAACSARKDAARSAPAEPANASAAPVDARGKPL